MRPFSIDRRRAGAFTVLLVAAAAGLPTAIAQGHASVTGTYPAKSGRAKTSIDVVKVAFSGPLRSGTISVRGPRGVVSVGRGGRDPRRISRLIVPLRRGLAAGRYRASWTAVAADGHRQSGSFLFRLVR